MKRRSPTLLSKFKRATTPYLRWCSTKLGSIAAGVWIDEFEISDFDDEEWVEAKFEACFGLQEIFESNTTPSFNFQDLEISRFIFEAIHIAVDLSIVFPRRSIEIYNLFARIVPMVTLIRSYHRGIDPTAALKDIAQAINQPSASRKLGQAGGKQFANKIGQAFVIAECSFEQGLLDAVWAIDQGIIEPMEVVFYLSAGGDESC